MFVKIRILGDCDGIGLYICNLSINLKWHLKKLENKTIGFAKSFSRPFPAVVVGAEFSYFKKTDKSKQIDSQILVRKLRDKLLTIGELYSKQNGNSVGCCAEVNCANQILIKRPFANLNNIKFSKAYRPRTMQVIPKCKNCKITFE
ncbi:hypothetical protein [Epilithonimonas sp. UC225_85]|uniref:hypothetical protein n=1 Tax=Epilithonimonas sp. UC225_85 TaxID=3350167 RepID=UPI0036D32174